MAVSCIKILDFLQRDFLLTFKNSLLLGIAYSFLIPVIRGISNLDEIHSAEVFGQSLALIGTILLVPVTKKELEPGVGEIIYTRPWPYRKSVSLRLLCGFFLIIAIVVGFACIMLDRNCRFPFWEYVLATVLYAVFLGVLGLVFVQAGNHIVAGYLASLGYWSCCQLRILDDESIACLFPVKNGGIEAESLFMLIGADILLLVIFTAQISKTGFFVEIIKRLDR